MKVDKHQNRPFYRHGGHIEYVRFNCEMPRRHEHIPFSIYERLFGFFFFNFS